MNKLLLSAILLVSVVSMGFSQENYSTWANVRSVVLNTKTTGAGSTTDLVNFPVLIRLTAADSLVFKKSQKNGQDIRFSKYNGIHFPYQIEQWDSAGKTASIWVKVDTVKANDSTKTAYPNGYLNMYCGKAAASDSSSGTSVFNATNYYSAVWHLSEEAAGTGTIGLYQDAVNQDAAGLRNGDDNINNTDQGGIIGKGHGFTSGPLSTGDNIAIQDTVQSLMNAPFTISLWAKVASGATYGGGIMSKRPGADWGGATFFYFGDGSQAPNVYGLCPSVVSAGNDWACQSTPVTPGVWSHIAYSFNASAGTAKIYINGASQSLTVNSLAPTHSDAVATSYIKIGANEADSGQYVSCNRTFNGNMDEFEIARIQREDDWILVSYKNQLSNAGRDSLTIPGPLMVPTGIVTPANSPANVAATPDFSVRMGHNGVLEVYMANGSRVMEIAYGASATKTQLLNTASKTLARGYYTYRFRGTDAHVDIVGKLVK